MEQRCLHAHPFYPACLHVLLLRRQTHTFTTLATLLSVPECKHKHPTQKLASICAVPEQFVENLQYSSVCAKTETKHLYITGVLNLTWPYSTFKVSIACTILCSNSSIHIQVRHSAPPLSESYPVAECLALQQKIETL